MKSSPLVLRIAAATVLVLALAQSALADPAIAPRGYPRLALYGSIRGNGYPFYEHPFDSSLSVPVLDMVSRYEEVILDINPIWPYRPDIIQQLKARSPGMKVLGYVVGQDIWPAADRDSTRHYPTRYRRLVNNNNGFLYNTRGQLYFAGNVNLPKRGPQGNYIIADSLALLWKQYTIDPGPGVWDGIFYDILCDDLSWTQLPGGDTVDVVRAGYPNFQQFNANWKAASDSIAERMRRWGGPNFIMVGNCALGLKYSTFNGWMREGFPFQAGGDWYSNMFWEPGGYMTDERLFLPPRHNYIFSFQVGTDPYTAQNNRIMRLGLGSASLGDGFGVFAGQDRDAFHSDYHTFWYDEYAVDLATGAASPSRDHVGWLGQPLSNFYQFTWISNEPDMMSNPGFENGFAGWNFWDQIGGTIQLDSTDVREGRYSARINIPFAHPASWKVAIDPQTNYQIEPFTTYSATFWIKASSPRVVPILVSTPTGQLITGRNINVGTEWTRLQVPFTYNGTQSAPAKLQFYLANNAGTVWLDDVHFQRGESTVYRRDFQNGTVLVNPSTLTFANVPLDRPFKRILGVSDPYTNNGAVETQVVVNPLDALFLLSTEDVTPPAAVNDLRLGPN